MIYYLYANAPAGLGFDKADAAQLISLYATVVGMTTIIGSYVCDRILGCRRSLLVARVTGFIGYTLLAFPLGVVGYAAAMGCMVFGSLFAGRCIETLIGKFYDENDGRRDSAFTISYVISNIGAAAPALAGVIAAKCGYHAAFALSAVLSFLGTVAYIATYKKFFGNIGLEPDDPLPADKKRSFVVKMLIVVAIVGTALAVSFATGKLKISSFANVVSTISIFIPLAYLVFIYSSKKTEKHEKKKVLCLLPPFICNAVTLLIWTQTISILAIFYEEKVNRVIFGVEIPAASFQTIPAIFAVCFGSFLTMLWTKLGKKQPFGTTKMGFGTILWGLGAMIIALLYIIYPGDAKVNAWWIVLFYAVLMFAEGFTCPIGYSITAVAAPKAFVTQMMTVWSMSQSVGAALNMILVNFYKEGSEVPFFIGIGAVVAILGAVVFAFSKKLAEGMGMQLKDIKKEVIFTTLYYELTWKIGWEQLLSILDVVIRTDFQEKGFQSLAVGMIAGTSPQDVTRDVLANGGDIRRSAFAKGESGYAVLTGYSHLMKVTMRIIVWNQSDRFILQLADDRAIDKDGKHSYDKYADSIEILAHIDYAKKQPAAVF